MEGPREQDKKERMTARALSVILQEFRMVDDVTSLSLLK